jgi:exodeoxyribonuclease V gamma subunit
MLHTGPPPDPRMTAAPLTSGLLVLHGNRLEDLARVVFDWLAAHPLAPLEEETLLVQSNGMAEWLKMELAAAHGVCAAARVELPARFLWRTYRAVLGREAVPALSPVDKLPLAWRLMRLLPGLAENPVFAPVAAFLGGAGRASAGEALAGDETRRLQRARRLADLFDQYQVYRSDWLRDWEDGTDALRTPFGVPVPVPAEQRWQPALWRAVVATLDEAARRATRPALHERFVRALVAPAGERPPAGVPRRVVIFGTTHVPAQTLQALAALARTSQVLLAVPNPCRHHWADLIEGRELLRAERRRHAPRGGVDLAAVPFETLHAHGHPLLAAWGRQSRDFIRQLDAYDDAQAARERFALPRIDLFDEEGAAGRGGTLLQQVQARIRDLVPLAEHEHAPVPAADRSIVFHQAHSAQREVEVLHDQLLELLARPPEAGERGPLAPRDIVVMVPDIDTFAPAIRSVFGQHARGDARFIPWGIADQRERAHNPLLAALEWVLRAPQQRFTATELLGLLEVPAVARRLGLREGDLPLLQGWIAAAGVRWGLDAAQRAALGLHACGDANTWAFGLRRMLLGYAVGAPVGDIDGFAFDGLGGADDTRRAGLAGIDEEAEAAAWARDDDDGPVGDAPEGQTRGAAVPAGRGDPAAARLAAIEPCAEVAGLSAGLAGALAEWLSLLQAWWLDAGTARTPVAWGERLRALLGALWLPGDPGERATLAALHDALAQWLQACEAAAFDEPVHLAVVREAWLDAVDEPSLAQRFKAGGVTFCTLLPLRAVPFEVVCLLGMNDGDYPRRGPRSDFDLMGWPGQARPGDRSRRDDDRQLMLDALLSARRVLYVSWCGRSQRDNQAQPPSVLVAQLRDYLAAGWGEAVVQARTTQHPLQPFSRAYFEERGGPFGLFTYAAEWRAAFGAGAEAATGEATIATTTTATATATTPPLPAVPGPEDAAPALTLQELARFLRNPVKSFFRRRLAVAFDEAGEAADDDEPFASGGLERWRQIDEVLREARRRLGEAEGGSDDAGGRRSGVASDAGSGGGGGRSGGGRDGGTGAAPAGDDGRRLARLVRSEVVRLQRAGHLPLAGPGRQVRAALQRTLQPMLAQWQAELAERPRRHEKLPLRWSARAGLCLEDWLVGLRAGGTPAGRAGDGERGAGGDEGGPGAAHGDDTPVWIDLLAAQLADRKGRKLQEHHLLPAWLRLLAASACDVPLAGVLIGSDVVVRLQALEDREASRRTLQGLMEAFAAQAVADEPLPTALRTGLAWLAEPGKAAGVYDGSQDRPGERREPCLARLFPDYEALSAQPRFEAATRCLYADYAAWLDSDAVAFTPLPDAAPADGGDDG